MTYFIPAATVLGPVKLKISQLARSIQFYENVVGLKVLAQDSTTATLTADGTTPLVLLEQIPNAIVAKPRSTSGLYHFAILLPTRQALGAALKRLIASGIHIGQADHLVSEALYISDPDNNGIEIYADRPRSTWKMEANGDYVMATDPLDWEDLLEHADDNLVASMPADTIIGHVHFHTVGLPQSRAFYNGLLGFDIVGDYAAMRALFVSAGGYHHHIGLNIWAGIGAPAPSPQSTGLDYFTIVYPSQDELRIALERLESAGTPAVQEKDGAVFATDPSGIRIHLTFKTE